VKPAFLGAGEGRGQAKIKAKPPNDCMRLPDPKRCGWLAAGLVWLAAAAAHADTLIAGPDGVPQTLRDAIRQARDGDTIQLLSGDYKGDVAVIEGRRLTLRGMGKRPVLHAEGRHAEGKGILVVRGGEVTIENVEFRGARVPDGNGAGIRFEKGRLTVDRCAFFDNEGAIMTGNDGEAELQIRDSEFGMAPRIVGGLHHLLYVGRIARAVVTGSRFYGGYEGHLIKSRARETRLLYNLIVDGPDGEASYEVELPNGGVAHLIGNVIGQSEKSQNATLVSFGAEGRTWDRNALYLSHNTLVGDPWQPNRFLRVWRDRLGEGVELKAVNNLLVGIGTFETFNDGHFEGNRWVLRRRNLQSVWSLEFELRHDSALKGTVAAAGMGGGMSLQPAAEFTLPVGTAPLKPATAWSPGAFQR
jgi:hypothetical protein